MLQKHFTVRTKKVRNALDWLCNHHEDYRNVRMNLNEFDMWDPEWFVASELLESIGRVLDPSAEDASRSGVATEDPDNDDVEGDLDFMTSAILDMNNVSQPPDSIALNNLIEL